MINNQQSTINNQQSVSIPQAIKIAVEHQDEGRLQQAERIYRQILKIEPDNGDANHLLGVIAHQVGKNEIAFELISKAIKKNPTQSSYFSNLGLVLLVQGKIEDAVASYQRALSIKPDYAEVHYNLGNALAKQGKLDQAVACLQKAISINPDFPEALSNLGNTLKEQGKLDGAVACYQKAISINPDYAEALSNLGYAITEQGKLDEAVACLQKAISINPDFPAALSNLGNALKEQGKLDEAVACYQKAISIKPDYAEAHCNLGVVLKIQGKIEEAVISYKRALSIKPDYTGAHYNLGNALLDQGKLEDAAASYERALSIKPEYHEAHSNLLFSLDYDEKLTSEEIFSAHKKWYDNHARGFELCSHEYSNDLDKNRRLRIGYVSGDFREHPIGYFTKGVFEAHDRNRVKLFCYSNSSREDSLTANLMKSADYWCSIVRVDDDTAAQIIHNDHIDILVDLSGHTAKNRLLVFARKPAPVQVTWLGYPNTTGLRSVDYRLTDRIADPRGSADTFYTEKLFRLPNGFLCFGTPLGTPDVSDVPFLKTDGRITFGSFNKLAKINKNVIQTWSNIINQTPGSRLLIKTKNLRCPTTKQRYLEIFVRNGLTPDQVELQPSTVSYAEHLAYYGKVDIALDTFPYNGTTTTCEALWMGVPVIALRGSRHAGSVSASILTQIDHTELIAEKEEEYIKKALALASDTEKLLSLRRDLRSDVLASSLCDSKGFARDLEEAYRTMWAEWCEKKVISLR